MKSIHVKNIKHNFVKFLAIILVFYVVLPVSQAFAYYSDFNGAGAVTIYDVTNGTGTFDLWSYNVFTQANPVIFPNGYDNLPYGQNLGDDILYYDQSTVAGDRVFVVVPEGVNPGTTITDAINNPQTIWYAFFNNAGTCLGLGSVTDCGPGFPTSPPPIVYTPPSFNLVAATSSFLGEISSPLIASVQETGASIWPMFVFVGVSLAFVIALQMIVFTKRAVGVNKSNLEGTRGRRGRKNPYSDPLHPDHEAFERGKRANKADGIDLFPDDK